MDNDDAINQYDIVEIIQVPEKLAAVIDRGDVGVVVEKFDEENFMVECIQPGGSSKWLETLKIKYFSLRLKIRTMSGWRSRSVRNQSFKQVSFWVLPSA